MRVKLRQKAEAKKGFTIVELLIYLSIFAILGGLAATVLDFTLRNRVVISRSNEVYLATERALSQIVDRVHAATKVTSASGSTLQLQMPSASLDPTFFSLSGGQVTIKEGLSATSTITPSSIIVDTLSFTKINNSTSSVQIRIRAGYSEAGTVKETTLYQLQTTALPLN